MNIVASTSASDVPTPYEYFGTVKEDWLDENGHMNVAFYMSAFDDGGEVFFQDPGIGWDYTRQGEFTIFVVSSKVDYRQELFRGDPFFVTTRLLDFNEKLVHTYYEIGHRDSSYIAATAEILYAHVSFATRKSAPFDQSIISRLEQIREAHASLPSIPSLGAGIGIRKSSG